MRRRDLILGASLAVLSVRSVRAAERRGPRRITVFTTANAIADLAKLREGLARLGLVEGTGYHLALVSANGDLSRLQDLVADVVRDAPDVVVAVSTPSVRAWRDAKTDIPIIMAVVSDPVALGLVDSLRRPGGTITGVTNATQHLGPKRLALLQEFVPHVRRVGAFYNPDDPITAAQMRDLSVAAPRFGVDLRFWTNRNPAEARESFAAAVAAGTEAVLFVPGLVSAYADTIASLPLQHRLPAAVTYPEHLAQGGLFAYYTDVDEHWDRVAGQVDRILKGTRPVDIPVEEPTRFRLTVSQRTARLIGIAIPPTLQAQADEVLE